MMEVRYDDCINPLKAGYEGPSMKRLAILATLALVIGMALALVIGMGSAAYAAPNCVLPGPHPITIVIVGALLALAIMRPART
jgi:hypothetical protein